MPRWLIRLNEHVPIRYGAWVIAGLGLLGSFWHAWDANSEWWAVGIFAFLVWLGFSDVRQSSRAILRNYPVIGHMRFLLEFVRPELRQYFIESDSEAAPFSRQQRSLVYQRAKGEPDKRPFGTQKDVTAAGYEWISHSMVPTHVDSQDFRITIGGDGSSCTQPYSASVFNFFDLIGYLFQNPFRI